MIGTQWQSMQWRIPQILQEKESAWASRNSKQWLPILIGCLDVRLPITFIIKMFWISSVNACGEGRDICGRCLVDPSWAQKELSVKWYLAENNIPVMGLHRVIYFSSESQVCAQGNHVHIHGCSDSHGQSNNRAWMKLCVKIDGNPQDCAPSSSSASKWPDIHLFIALQL